MANYKENAGLLAWKKDSETRRLQNILKTDELKPATLTKITPAVISAFKLGKENRIRQGQFDELKRAINELIVFLNNFISMDIQSNNDYFEKVLNLSDRKEINFKMIYNRINSVKPSYQYLYWNYWNSSYNKDKNVSLKGEEIINQYRPFFEQLKFEIVLLKSKLKL